MFSRIGLSASISSSRRHLSLPGVLLVLLLSGPGSLSARGQVDIARVGRGVVKITTTFFEYDYRNPWKQPILHMAGGTGFIVDGNHILTNAHVVSLANTIRVQRPNQRTDYRAHVIHIAHDCDLAMLAVDDPTFFKGSEGLQIGETPELNSPVTVVGFPIGGDRVSITRGVVSREDIDAYAHSQIDYHLTIQVDAAINPGNSGGPALQNGRVIGVAFQTLTAGENLGYLIPPPVIHKFLTDIRDGHYDGYIEFGTMDTPTVNPIMKEALHLDQISQSGDTGVYIYGTIPGSSADGILKPGDVLLSLDGHTISETGDVEKDGQMQSYTELVDNASKGTPIRVEVWRGGKKIQLEFPARITRIINFQRKNYDTSPPYYITGGLVFQPLGADLMEAYARDWAAHKRADILFRYRNYLSAGIYKEAYRDVVFTRKLDDEVNLYADHYQESIVESVNGDAVRDFSQFVHLMDLHVHNGAYLILRFRGESIPLVLRTSDLKHRSPLILEQYGIQKDRFLTEEK